MFDCNQNYFSHVFFLYSIQSQIYISLLGSKECATTQAVNEKEDKSFLICTLGIYQAGERLE